MAARPETGRAAARWGGAARAEWMLDPRRTFLNHGSFGATPRAVLAVQAKWRRRMERRPTGFMAYELPGALREAAGRLAGFLGARSDDLVFVENATAGCNAVLRSLRLGPGDEILLTDHGYPAVRKTAEHVAGQAGARVVVAPVPFPVAGPSPVVASVAARLSARTRLAILDHVTSPTALVFPVAELTSLCRSAGVPVLVDGAHAPGMLELDVPAIGADWYVGNCHKWLMAPKGAGFLWAAPARQAGLHPPVISHGYGAGFLAEFDWIGTRDPSAWLSVPAALEFHDRLGGASLRRRNSELAAEVASLLRHYWRTECGTADAAAMQGAMATIRLPSGAGEATPERALERRAWLDREHRIEVPIVAFAGALWARVSAQAYNERADYERLARAF
jgi:isopenicillin-N epimerase